jgi:hypothetical protein
MSRRYEIEYDGDDAFRIYDVDTDELSEESMSKGSAIIVIGQLLTIPAHREYLTWTKQNRD